MADTTRTLKQRLAACREEVSKITFTKDKFMDLGVKKKKIANPDPEKAKLMPFVEREVQLGYNYISIDQILGKINPIEAKHGVLVTFGQPIVSEDNVIEGITKTRDQVERVSTHVIAHVDVTVEAAEGDEVRTRTVLAEATESTGDKLVRKLMTSAQRVYYMTEYNISEGVDAEDFNQGSIGEDNEGQLENKKRGDRFFDSPPKEEQTKKEKQTEEPIPPADVPVTETTLERPREVKEDTINKACKDLNLRKVVMSFAKDKGYGYNTETWTEEQINEVYSAVVTAGRS